jgi:hypothetical protein
MAKAAGQLGYAVRSCSVKEYCSRDTHRHYLYAVAAGGVESRDQR